MHILAIVFGAVVLLWCAIWRGARQERQLWEEHDAFEAERFEWGIRTVVSGHVFPQASKEAAYAEAVRSNEDEVPDLHVVVVRRAVGGWEVPSHGKKTASHGH